MQITFQTAAAFVAPRSSANGRCSTLERRLGASDVAFIAIGSIIGSGIFRTPSAVAQQLHAPALILCAWALGGVVALFGAFFLGELAARRPQGCGIYAYLQDAFHPVVGFAYGWTSLLASFSGGLAAAAVLFAGYFTTLTGFHIASGLLAAIALATLALVNCLGVRQGGNVQNGLTVLKLAAFAAVIVAGFAAHPPVPSRPGPLAGAPTTLAAFSFAMIPVLFTYNGAMVANFMATEVKRASVALPRGLWLGVSGVAIVYLLVNGAFIHALGVGGLAATDVPASAVLFVVLGSPGARVAALAIVIATLGFIGNRLLTVPRLYQSMAQDGLFFRSVASIDPRTHVPVVAIAVQALVAIVIALTGSYEQILSYVVSTFYVFNGLSAVALFVIRARDERSGNARTVDFRVPWHPVSTAIYLVASLGVAIATYIAYPGDALLGLLIVLTAIPVYFVWVRSRPTERTP